MKIVKRTKEHVIYKKRSGRHAVVDAKDQWVRGPEKVQVLTDAGILKKLKPKAKPAAEAAAETKTETPAS